MSLDHGLRQGHEQVLKRPRNLADKTATNGQADIRRDKQTLAVSVCPARLSVGIQLAVPWRLET